MKWREQHEAILNEISVVSVISFNVISGSEMAKISATVLATFLLLERLQLQSGQSILKHFINIRYFCFLPTGACQFAEYEIPSNVRKFMVNYIEFLMDSCSD